MLDTIHVATMMPLSSGILDEHRLRGKFHAANMENCINRRCKCCHSGDLGGWNAGLRVLAALRR
jgi:hypothetical protein